MYYRFVGDCIKNCMIHLGDFYCQCGYYYALVAFHCVSFRSHIYINGQESERGDIQQDAGDGGTVSMTRMTSLHS